jgi:hypothetical protein
MIRSNRDFRFDPWHAKRRANPPLERRSGLIPS